LMWCFKVSYPSRMSATHHVTVVNRAGAILDLRVAVAHPDVGLAEHANDVVFGGLLLPLDWPGCADLPAMAQLAEAHVQYAGTSSITIQKERPRSVGDTRIILRDPAALPNVKVGDSWDAAPLSEPQVFAGAPWLAHSMDGVTPNVRRLYLWNRDLTSIPADLERLVALRELNVNGSRISTLRNVLPQLPELRVLRAGTLDKLPKGLTSLKHLHTLMLTIAHPGPELAQCNALACLTIEGVTSVDPSFASLKLDKLYCGIVGDTFPDELFELQQLRVLSLSARAKITSLPDAITKLPALRVLDIRRLALGKKAADRLRELLPHVQIIHKAADIWDRAYDVVVPLPFSGSRGVHVLD